MVVRDFAAPHLPTGAQIKVKETPGCATPTYDVWTKTAGDARGKWAFRISFPDAHMRADTTVVIDRTR